MVGRLRSALRAYALEGHDPATVVEQLNRLVWTEVEDSQMATLLYVVIDPAEGAVRWVNAGHPAPLLVVGEAAAALPRGRQLGAARRAAVPRLRARCRSRIEPGGTVVLYTDGLVERPGEHIDDGLARLADGVRRGAARPGAAAATTCSRELVPAAGAPDDVALLALRNTADQRALPASSSRPSPRRSPRMRDAAAALARARRQGSEHEIAEITTACGEAATNAIEHAGGRRDAVRGRGRARAARGRDRGARLRRLARRRARATRAAGWR